MQSLYASRGQKLAGLACVIGGLFLAAASPASAQRAPTVTNVSGAFRSGPYTGLSVDVGNPYRVAIGTADGHVLWTEDGGASVDDARVVSPRYYDAVTIRGGARLQFSQRGATDPVLQRHQSKMGFNKPDERSLLQFLDLLGKGLPGGRWQAWMSVADPWTDISQVAWPPGDGPMLAAGSAGILVSDNSRWTWLRTLGAPGPMPREQDMFGLSVGIDPINPKHMLAATDRGVMVSDTGGYTWAHHRDPNLEGAWITRIIWDPDNPQLVFAVAPDTIMLSQDGGQSFEPSFAADGEIRNLALSPEAAVVATDKGVQVATAEGINTFLQGKDLIGAIPWRDGALLAATKEDLYYVAPDGSYKPVLHTTNTDPFLSLQGNSRIGWLLSTHTILRIGDSIPRKPTSFNAKPPRMLISLSQLERAVIKRTGLGGPEDTRVHARWYAKLLPRVTATFRGTLASGEQTRRDDTVLPGQIWQTAAYAWDQNYWEVFAMWDLREFIFGDDNASNPNLIIESSIRDKRKTVIDQVRWHYRELAALVADLARPPADPALELRWRMKVDEHASYLEFISGERVVERTKVEDLDIE